MSLSPLRRLISLSPRQWDVAERLALVFALLQLFRWLVTWQVFAPLVGAPSLTVDQWPLLLTLLPAILLAAFFLAVRDDLREEDGMDPQPLQATCAIALLGLTLAGVVLALHPTATTLQFLGRFVSRDPSWHGMVIGAGVWLLLSLPVAPLFLSLFSLRFLRRHGATLLSGWLLYVAYLYGEVANALYFRWTGPFLVDMVREAARLLPGDTVLHHTRWDISYNGFSVVIGFACTEFSSLVLLLGLLGFVWWRKPPRTGRQTAFAIALAVVGVGGLFVLNVIRIVSILIVGAWWPAFASGLFHSSVGSLLLLVYTAVFVRYASRKDGR